MTVFDFLGQALTGWLIADALSGVVHWSEDRFFAERANWFGRNVIGPNREHHRLPLAMFRYGVIERNSTSWMVVVPLAALWFAVAGFSVVWLFAVAGGLVTYEVHRLSHAPRRAGRLLRIAQEIGIIQSPKHHARHHAPPQDRHFCSLTDFLNPIFDGLGVWQRLERGIAVIGITPSLGER